MSDYNEHLISMAGGDGDVAELLSLAADLADPDWCLSVPSTAKVTITRLLAMVREQRAAIERVKAELVAREDRWKKAWEDGELTHEEAVSATLEDRWAYAQLAGIRAALIATEDAS